MQYTEAWQVESLRMSFFFDIKDRNRWESLWSAITKQPAESTTEKNNLKQTIEEGSWNGHPLTVSLQANRVDVYWRATEESAELPNIGKFFDLIEPFKESVISVLTQDRLSSIQRAALGAVMLIPANSKEEAYLCLGKYLPSVQVSKDSRDFQYQINRPIRTPHSKDREVNRFSRWAAIRANFFDFNTSSVGVLTIASRLEIDVSTSAENLYKEEQPITLDEILELSELAKNIALNGDVP